MRSFLCTVSLLFLFNCSGKEKPTHSTVQDTSQTTEKSSPTQTAEASSAKTIQKNTLSASAGKWTYEKKVNQSGSTVYKAFVTSPDVLEFNFPYTGGSTATLTIRQIDDRRTVYLEVSKGQFNRSFQGGDARLRFDGTPAIKYSFSAAENGRANIIFFDSAQALIDRIKASQKISIDVEFYAQGRRQITFKTADLDWDH